MPANVLLFIQILDFPHKNIYSKAWSEIFKNTGLKAHKYLFIHLNCHDRPGAQPQGDREKNH